jgi:signal transduction histidine kinase
MADPALVDRLAAHKKLGRVPREQLEWLADHGGVLRYEAGALAAEKGVPLQHLYVLLSGHISISVNRGGSLHKVFDWVGGDVSGFMPFSRMQGPPGDTVVEEATEVLAIHRSNFPEMLRACPDVVEVLVHAMIDRARAFNADELHSKRMESLGVLAAGLAHELNNPASAIVRSADHLKGRLEDLERALVEYARAGVSHDEHALAVSVRQQASAAAKPVESALQLSDREEALGDWLADHKADDSLAHPLATMGLPTATFDALAGMMPSDRLAAVLQYLAADQGVREIADEISVAGKRMSDLVSAVKRFSYVDHASSRKPVDIVGGIADTITLLGSKAKTKSVDVRLEAPSDLPRVDGLGGELNQVWTNLIANAIDAAPVNGHVLVKARSERGCVFVSILDDGPGVPDEIKPNIFVPFFTTKDVGQGTGLGLQIARQIVRAHGGELELSAHSPGAEFVVRLPTDGGPAR